MTLFCSYQEHQVLAVASKNQRAAPRPGRRLAIPSSFPGERELVVEQEWGMRKDNKACEKREL